MVEVEGGVVMLKGAFLIVLVLFFCWQMVQAPWLFALEQVEVRGAETLSAQQVEKLAGVWRGENLFWLNVREVTERLTAHPQIAGASVRRHWPNKLHISVAENIGLAVIPYHDGFVEIDGHGKIISIVPDFSRVNLPIITGVPLTDIALGDSIVHPLFAPAHRVVLNLPSSVRSSVSEINIGENGFVNITTTTGILIRLGNETQTQSRLALLPAVLYAYKNRGLSRETTAYIDMTGEVPVYKGR